MPYDGGELRVTLDGLYQEKLAWIMFILYM